MNGSGQQHCAQCGAELYQGAGFCRVCGAPAVSRAGAVPPPPMPPRMYQPPASPQQRSSSSSPTFIAFGCAVFLVGIFLTSFLIVRNVRYNRILDRMVSRNVRALAEDFFRKTDQGAYKNAYSLLDGDYARIINYDTFERGMRSTNEKLGRVKRRELKSVSRNIFFKDGQKHSLYRLKYATRHRRGMVPEELLIIENKQGCSLHAYRGPWTPATPRHPQAGPNPPFEPRESPYGRSEQSREDPKAVAEQYFKYINDGEDTAAYQMLDGEFQKFTSLEEFKKLMADMRKTLGARKRQALTFNATQTIIQGNKYAIVYQLGYTSQFEKGIAREEIVLKDIDGKLMVDNYKIVSDGITMPERKAPAPGEPDAMPEPEHPQLRGPRTDV